MEAYHREQISLEKIDKFNQYKTALKPPQEISQMNAIHFTQKNKKNILI